MTITIRKSEQKDINSLIEFQLRMAKETEGLELNLERLSKGVTAVFSDHTKGIYYVAEIENKVVASLLTTYEWSDWRNGQVIWIQSVYVLPEFRRQGIYKKMYLHLKDMVEKSEYLLGLRLYVEKDNITAQKTYSDLGMDGEHYKMFEWLNRNPGEKFI